jgi:glycosyltransferase involved in cell wall biosynthesis
MNEPLVSIIIPVYNSEKYLTETIQSALDQTWPNKEIIIIDDGSSDASLKVSGSFESPVIRVFHQKNKGASSARNYGLREAQGEYVQFLDADDLLPTDKIEKQMSQLIKNPDCIIGCRWVRFKYSLDHQFGTIGPHVSIKTDLSPLKWLLIRHTMLLHAWLIPKGIIEKAGCWDETLSYNDDGEYMARVIAQTKKVLYTNDTIVYYRTEDAVSISTLNSEKKYLSAYKAAESYKTILYKLSEGSAEAQIAIGNYFKELMYSFYPLSLQLVEKCMMHPEIKMANQDFADGGKITKMISFIFGWRLTKRFKNLFYSTARKPLKH